MTVLLVSGAGGGGSNNLISGLRALTDGPQIIGTNAERNWLARSTADVNYLVARSTEESRYFAQINRIVERESVDLFIPNNDTEADVVARNKDLVNCRTFLPSGEATRICRDKFALYELLTAGGVRLAKSVVVEDLSRLSEYFEFLGNPERVWCRMRTGSGSRGSLPVSSAEQAGFWIGYWNENWGIHHSEFTLSEFLPGRDFACQSIWQDGKLLICKVCERIEYLFGRNMPSGTSSSPQFGRLVRDQRVDQLCAKVIPLVDPRANGVFSMDLKEAADGEPCVTEINAGRFFMITPVFNESGRHNMAAVYVKTALGQGYEVPESDRFGDIGEEPIYLFRSADQLPLVLAESEVERRILLP